MSRKISQFNNASTPLTGTELIPVLQSSKNRKILHSDFTLPASQVPFTPPTELDSLLNPNAQDALYVVAMHTMVYQESKWLESGTLAFDHYDAVNWTIDSSQDLILFRVGSIVTVSGKFVFTLTGAGQKFLVFACPGLDEPAISRAVGLARYDTYAGSSGVGGAGWGDTNEGYTAMSDVASSGSGEFSFQITYRIDPSSGPLLA